MVGFWHCWSLIRSSVPSQHRPTISCREPPMDVAELQLIPTRLSQHREPLTDRHPTPTRHRSDMRKGQFQMTKSQERTRTRLWSAQVFQTSLSWGPVYLACNGTERFGFISIVTGTRAPWRSRPAGYSCSIDLGATSMGHSQSRKRSRSTRDISSCDYSMPRFPIAIRINWSPLAREIIKDHNPWIPPTRRRLSGGT